MKTKNRFWKDRDIKDCGCGSNHFKTVVKDKAYGCVKCEVVKIVTDPQNLTDANQKSIDDFRLCKMNKKEASHKRLVQLTKNSVDKKKRTTEYKAKKEKKNRFFDFSRFRRKPKPPNVVISPLIMKDRAVIAPKTEKSTEKK